MHQRAQHKLATEAAVIGAGRFHHGSVSAADGGEAEGSGGGRKKVVSELLSACLRDDAAEAAEAASEKDAETRPSPSPVALRAVSSLGNLRAGGAVQPLPASTEKRQRQQTQQARQARHTFAALPTATLNALCARCPEDLVAFARWDAHCAAREAAVAAAVAGRAAMTAAPRRKGREEGEDADSAACSDDADTDADLYVFDADAEVVLAMAAPLSVTASSSTPVLATLSGVGGSSSLLRLASQRGAAPAALSPRTGAAPLAAPLKPRLMQASELAPELQRFAFAGSAPVPVASPLAPPAAALVPSVRVRKAVHASLNVDALF